MLGPLGVVIMFFVFLFFQPKVVSREVCRISTANPLFPRLPICLARSMYVSILTQHSVERGLGGGARRVGKSL